jgi:hypothetical protein
LGITTLVLPQPLNESANPRAITRLNSLFDVIVNLLGFLVNALSFFIVLDGFLLGLVLHPQQCGGVF